MTENFLKSPSQIKKDTELLNKRIAMLDINTIMKLRTMQN